MQNTKAQYPGWELKYFDRAYNFRNYQFLLIKKYIKKNVAEIGPGSGVILKKYIKQCKNIDLYEPDIKLFRNLKKKFKNKKIVLKNKTFKTYKKYDTIIILDVLEHISNDKNQIQKLINSLNKGGSLIINVPAFNLLYSKFDRDIGHFRRYNKTNIKNKIKGLKFLEYKMFYYDSLGFVLSLMSKIFYSKKYKNQFENKIKLWDMFIPISKIIDFFIFNRFGKSLCIIIRK
jgi:SAM-dependent methyltransferase